MPLTPFSELMAEAERGNYAVGYFESWNLESLLAVADAAEAARSPVILGFSGVDLPHPDRVVRERLAPYAALGLEVCRGLTVPSCLLFNESPDLQWVLDAVDLGFNLVMFSDEEMSPEEQIPPVRRVVAYARSKGEGSFAVEAEVATLPGISSDLTSPPADVRETTVADATAFVEATGIDALAVNIGQAHLHGRSEVRLNLERLAELRRALPVPLVLHGATSVRRTDLASAVRMGIRKINVGSILKRTYFEALRRAADAAGTTYNPYEVVGSGRANDVLTAARVAEQAVVEDLMHLFGSAGRG